MWLLSFLCFCGIDDGEKVHWGESWHTDCDLGKKKWFDIKVKAVEVEDEDHLNCESRLRLRRGY